MIYDILNPTGMIPIGRVGENHYRSVEFDLSSWLSEYPGGNISAIFIRPDLSAYPITLLVTDMIATWYITNTDVEKAGIGEIQLTMIIGGTIAKSAIFKTKTEKSLDADLVPPEKAKYWLGELLETSDEAAQAAAAATTAARRANEAAANVKNGKDGSSGKDGADGISATHSWNGTTLTITSASGTSSADLKGEKGDPYTLTDEDKAAIVASVLESIGTPVFGYVDENNNVVVKGDLADGTYTVKYEMEDGSIIDIGRLVLDSNVYYSITKNLTNCTINNSADEVAEGESYSATITANSGYELKSVSVTMGGAAVTVTNGVINVAGVTGNIVITAVAEEIKASYTNLADPTSADWGTNKRLGSDGTFRDLSGNIVTNYIEVTRGDVIRVKGLNLVDSASNSSYMGTYNTTKSVISVGMPNSQTAYFSDISVTSEGGQLTYSLTAPSETVLIRFGGKPNNTANDIIITINEPID